MMKINRIVHDELKERNSKSHEIKEQNRNVEE